jgi:hypothetical protein
VRWDRDGALRSRSGFSDFEPAAPRDGYDPRGELARREGLDDVIVRAELESERTRSISSPLAISMTIGTSDSLRISRARSRPSPSGSITSSNTRSGEPRVGRASRAPASVGATSASNSSRPSLSASGSEIVASSSHQEDSSQHAIDGTRRIVPSSSRNRFRRRATSIWNCRS